MATVNQIRDAIDTLPVHQRAALVQELNISGHAPPSKRKVNGFMGFRAYYSSLFSHLPQKDRSPILTTLWHADRCHAQWDFLCSVYSQIREDLQREGKKLQDWIVAALPQLGITYREQYLSTFSWHLDPSSGGTTLVFRHDSLTTALAAGTDALSSAPTMTDLGLFRGCVANGLALSDSANAAILQKLSRNENQILLTHLPAISSQYPTGENTKEIWQTLAALDPSAAMAALFQRHAQDPLFAQGVRYYQIDDSNNLLKELDDVAPLATGFDQHPIGVYPLGSQNAEGFESILNTVFEGETQTMEPPGGLGIDCGFLDPELA